MSFNKINSLLRLQLYIKVKGIHSWDHGEIPSPSPTANGKYSYISPLQLVRRLIKFSTALYQVDTIN